MTFRGRGGGRFGGRGGGGRGQGRPRYEDTGPPATVVELGMFTHTCLEQIVCKCTTEKIPYFNAPVFLENKNQIGKVDEIFGGIRNHSISVTLGEDFKAASFAPGDKVFVDPYKLLPLERFLPGAEQSRGRGRGSSRGRGFRGDFSDRGRGGRGRGSFDRGRGSFDRGRGSFDRGRGSFDRGRGSFDRGRGSFDRGRGSFDRARGSFDRGRGGRGNFGNNDKKRSLDSSFSSGKKTKFEE